MHLLRRVALLSACVVVVMLSMESASPGRQATTSLQGRVTDDLGGVIPNAIVTVISSNQMKTTAKSNDQGVFIVGGLAAGKYIVTVEAAGFAQYESDLSVSAERRAVLNIKMTVAIPRQNLTIPADDSRPSLDPDRNKGGIVLRGADLDSLPDDPEELANALQAMAGPSAGLDGGQIFIDGFSNGSVPSKSAIREIRINQNPFAAEHDRIGFGRIEIFTRSGDAEYHGGAIVFYNNRAFNTSNPFVSNHPPYHFVFYGGDFSGPIVNKDSTFTLNFLRRDIEDNSIVNATILDTSLTPTTFNRAVVAPRKFLDITPRFDHQFNKNNTLALRYSYTRLSFQNAGVGQFSLPSRGYKSSNTEHSLQLTDTALLGSNAVNELRLQYFRGRTDQAGSAAGLIPTILVRDSFIDGGPQISEANNTIGRVELQNYTTWLKGRHTLRFGGRLRRASLEDLSTANFEGMYLFLGAVAPVLDAKNRVVFGAHSFPLFESITSLEGYRRTLLFRREVVGPKDITALGGNPTFLQITIGDPGARVRRIDFGGFLQDDWRLRPNFTMSYGLRYEAQSNVDSNYGFAPRLAFAWSPGMSSARSPKTVVRGGAGIFYERVSEGLSLQATRFDGVRQSEFLIPGPAQLGLYPELPSADALKRLGEFKTIVRLAPDLTVPYTIQSGISVERQWWSRITTSLAFLSARGVHYLRSRNVNAPLPGTFDPRIRSSGIRPFGNTGNVSEYESNGIFKQRQLVLNASGRLRRGMTFFASYFLAQANSDTDGPDTLPANGYDFKGEFGRSSLDIRHRASIGLSIRLPWAFTVSPFAIVSSGVPFNIVSGATTSGDTLAVERPAFATDLSQPSVKVTKYGNFDLDPGAGQVIIPRNFAQGHAYSSMSLRLARAFSFGGGDSARSSPMPEKRQEASGPAPGSSPASDGRPAAGLAQAAKNQAPVSNTKQQTTSRSYTLTLSVLAFNIFNRVNPGIPIGNLSAPLFGQSTSLGGPIGVSLAGGNAVASNRRIDVNIRLTF